jgi:hypothetical protein
MGILVTQDIVVFKERFCDGMRRMMEQLPCRGSSVRMAQELLGVFCGLQGCLFLRNIEDSHVQVGIRVGNSGFWS